jgi:hypothetical protein
MCGPSLLLILGEGGLSSPTFGIEGNKAANKIERPRWREDDSRDQVDRASSRFEERLCLSLGLRCR